MAQVFKRADSICPSNLSKSDFNTQSAVDLQGCLQEERCISALELKGFFFNNAKLYSLGELKKKFGLEENILHCLKNKWFHTGDRSKGIVQLSLTSVLHCCESAKCCYVSKYDFMFLQSLRKGSRGSHRTPVNHIFTATDCYSSEQLRCVCM